MGCWSGAGGAKLRFLRAGRECCELGLGVLLIGGAALALVELCQAGPCIRSIGVELYGLFLERSSLLQIACRGPCGGASLSDVEAEAASGLVGQQLGRRGARCVVKSSQRVVRTMAHEVEPREPHLSVSIRGRIG